MSHKQQSVECRPQGAAERRPRAWTRLGLCAPVAVAVLLVISAVAVAAAPRRNASYSATAAHSTVISLHTSAHGRIATYRFVGKCSGSGGWFFDSIGERAIPVSAKGAFALRRTEGNAGPKSQTPKGTFTFTISGRFGSGGRSVSGTLSFVEHTSLGVVSCATGSVAFHGRLTSVARKP